MFDYISSVLCRTTIAITALLISAIFITVVAICRIVYLERQVSK